MYIYRRSINNKLQQTFKLYTWEWGVQVIVENNIEGQKNVKFDERRFRICKTYPTIKDNIKRAMHHWHLTDDDLVYFIDERRFRLDEIISFR